jgi:hypothetical protein
MQLLWKWAHKALGLLGFPAIMVVLIGFILDVRLNYDDGPSVTIRLKLPHKNIVTTPPPVENTPPPKDGEHTDGVRIVFDPRVVASREWDIVIVGAGLSGAVLAERFASVMGKSVLVIEKRDHIGGNCYDYVDEETGILVNKYGPHLFHTDNERVWAYLQRFAAWRRYDHQVSSSPTPPPLPPPPPPPTPPHRHRNRIFILLSILLLWAGASERRGRAPRSGDRRGAACESAAAHAPGCTGRDQGAPATERSH